eukprot:jgi/Mesvir1/19575/Mv09879-RA.1
MVSKRGINENVFRKLLKREESGRQSSRFFHQVPPRLRIPVATLVDESRQLLQCVLLGFTRSGDFLISYSADGAFASSAPGAEGPSRARYHLQVWRFTIHEPLRLFAWAPLFRASGGWQVDLDPEGDSDEEDPELHLREESRSHLLITLYESPDQRFLVVHGIPTEGDVGGSAGAGSGIGTPDRIATPGSSSAGTVRNYVTVLPSPSVLHGGSDMTWRLGDGCGGPGGLRALSNSDTGNTYTASASAMHAAPTIRCGHASYLTVPPQSPSLPALAFLPPDRLVVNTSSAVLVLALEFTSGIRAQSPDIHACACNGNCHVNDTADGLGGGLYPLPSVTGTLGRGFHGHPPPAPIPIPSFTQADAPRGSWATPSCADWDGGPTQGGFTPAGSFHSANGSGEHGAGLQAMLGASSSHGMAGELHHEISNAGMSSAQLPAGPRKRPFRELAHRRDSRSPADKGPAHRRVSLHEGDCVCVASTSPLDGLEDSGVDRLVLVAPSGSVVREDPFTMADAAMLPHAYGARMGHDRLDTALAQVADAREMSWLSGSNTESAQSGWGLASQPNSSDRVHADSAAAYAAPPSAAEQAQQFNQRGHGARAFERAAPGSRLDGEEGAIRGDGQDRGGARLRRRQLHHPGGERGAGAAPRVPAGSHRSILCENQHTWN